MGIAQQTAATSPQQAFYLESRKFCKSLGRASQAEERTAAQTCWEDAKNADEVRLTNVKKGTTQTQSTWPPTHMAPSSEPSLDIFLRTMALSRQLVTEERHDHLDAFIAPICVFVENGTWARVVTMVIAG